MQGLRRSLISAGSGVALLLGASGAAAQSPPLPPVRQLGPVSATSTVPLGNMLTLRQLPGGKVLVNDVARRQLLLLDSALVVSAVVADSTDATGNAYSGRVAGLIAYRGDSTLFVDPQSLSMQVIDPAGRVGRVMSVPGSHDAFALTGMQGAPGFDAAGRLVYRANPRFQMRGGPGAAAPEIPDSAAIVRVDLATRALDTLGFIRTPRVQMEVTRHDDGSMSMTSKLNPLPVVDDWAVLSDGSVMFVRGRDYRVEVIGADGSRIASQKVPFEWQRLSDEDKVAFIDSVRVQRERMAASSPGGQVVTFGGAAAGAPAGSAPEIAVSVVQGGPGGERRVRGGGPGGAGGPGMRRNLTLVDPAELPDYKPAFFANSARADADGRVWIRTIPTKALGGGPVYDVIDAKGVLVDRVQVPAGRTVAGFGAGGIVYLLARGAEGSVLERAQLR